MQNQSPELFLWNQVLLKILQIYRKTFVFESLFNKTAGLQVYFEENLRTAAPGNEMITQINRSSHHRCSMKKGVCSNFAKFTGKHLYHSLFFNKVSGNRRFPVHFAKFLRAPIFQNTSGRLFLNKEWIWITIRCSNTHSSERNLMCRNRTTIASCSKSRSILFHVAAVNTA